MDSEAMRAFDDVSPDPLSSFAELPDDAPLVDEDEEVFVATTVVTDVDRDTMEAGNPVTAVGLSAVMEGLGQAYNRQPAKAVAFVTAGLAFSTASGLNTWLVRRVPGLKRTRIGPDRIHPRFLALWAVTYVLGMLDAWRNAR